MSEGGGTRLCECRMFHGPAGCFARPHAKGAQASGLLEAFFVGGSIASLRGDGRAGCSAEDRSAERGGRPPLGLALHRPLHPNLRSTRSHDCSDACARPHGGFSRWTTRLPRANTKRSIRRRGERPIRSAVPLTVLLQPAPPPPTAVRLSSQAVRVWGWSVVSLFVVVLVGAMLLMVARRWALSGRLGARASRRRRTDTRSAWEEAGRRLEVPPTALSDPDVKDEP